MWADWEEKLKLLSPGPGPSAPAAGNDNQQYPQDLVKAASHMLQKHFNVAALRSCQLVWSGGEPA